MLSQHVLEMRNIVKEYFGNRVLKGVSLTVDEGEIHSLIGENGAGKSTLMNVLFGMPVIHNTGGFEGEVLFQGKPVQIGSPFEAMELGIGMVHQEFMLLPGFTISENIKLNREITRSTLLSRFFGRSMNRLDRPAMDADSRRALDSLGLSLDETTRVAGLPVGYKQFVEIARELDKKKTKILVLDEPTAVLTESEADTLLETMERLAQRGISILFITHRLQEVLRVSRGISVLRDGETVATIDKSEATIGRLAELMVGRALQSVGCEGCDDSPASEEILLTVNNLHVDMPGEEVHGINLDIRKGEIFGIGGLAGQGKIGIANGIMGLYPARGAVTKSGRPVPLNDTTSALNAAMAFVSEDRRGVGLLLDQSIEMNIAVPAMQSQGKFLKGPFALADDRAIRTHALKLIKDLDIRCVGPMQRTRRLSGGNQQKVCIAKALTLEPDLLFVSEPTRGIDVGAKKIVLDLLVKLNRELGVTIVITSSELAELRAICDRIALIYHGQVEGILAPDASDKDFGIMMAGGIKNTMEREVS